jgi:uncharacterized protein (DUF934 family)
MKAALQQTLLLQVAKWQSQQGKQSSLSEKHLAVELAPKHPPHPPHNITINQTQPFARCTPQFCDRRSWATC